MLVSIGFSSKFIFFTLTRYSPTMILSSLDVKISLKSVVFLSSSTPNVLQLICYTRAHTQHGDNMTYDDADDDDLIRLTNYR